MPTERRKHRRAQLTMPVRLRWPGPLGQCVEISKTLDVSRGGALVRSANPGVPGAPLWVTFPYDNSLSSNLPETSARVVRSERQSEDTYVVAIHFELAAPLNGYAPKPPVERRRSPRAAFAIPALLHPPSRPWPEETMTVDVSSRGMRLTATRIYTVG